jgi:hypothetical protein
MQGTDAEMPCEMHLDSLGEPSLGESLGSPCPIWGRVSQVTPIAPSVTEENLQVYRRQG